MLRLKFSGASSRSANKTFSVGATGDGKNASLVHGRKILGGHLYYICGKMAKPFSRKLERIHARVRAQERCTLATEFRSLTLLAVSFN